MRLVACALAIASCDRQPAAPPPERRCPSGEGLADSPWPMHGRCPDHRARSALQGPTSPSLRWRLEGLFFSSPAIGRDGTLYLGARLQRDTALVAVTAGGEIRWRAPMERVLATPAVTADGVVIAAEAPTQGGRASLCAHGEADGARRWCFDDEGDATWSSPAVGPDGTIYAGGPSRRIIALRPDGTLAWARPVGWVRWWHAPAIGEALWVSSDRGLFAYSLNGDPLFADELGGSGACSSPLLGREGEVIVASCGEGLRAFTRGGAPSWEARGEGLVSMHGEPALGEGFEVIVGGDDGYLRVLERGGAERSRVFVSGLGPVAVGADGLVYVNDGNVRCYDQRGELRFKLPAAIGGSASLTIGDGALYVVDASGLLAIGGGR